MLNATMGENKDLLSCIIPLAIGHGEEIKRLP